MTRPKPSLADEIRSSMPKTGVRCGMCIAFSRVSDEDREDLERAMADPAIPGTVISRVLINRGHDVRPPAVSRHRRGDCDSR